MLNHSCVCPDALDRCDRCDLLLDFPGLHLVSVTQAPSGLVLEVESCVPVQGCPGCGVIATGHGRVVVEVIDAPWAGRPVRVRWRKRRWICHEDVCAVVSFVEQDPEVCAPRGLLSTRAIRWSIGQLRREGATIQGLARQLGTTWNTLWTQVRPVLATAADDPVRFENVQVLGVDEHIWHHRDPRRRGPKELTGMVELTRGPHPTARLLDLVPGRSGKAYRDWLDERGEGFRKRVEIATLDPFQGYKNAIDDQLEDATCVLDAFHIVKLAGAAVDDVRRRIQQETLGHRGRKGDPSTASAMFSAPGENASRLASRLAWKLRSRPIPITSRSKSPIAALRTFGTCSTSPRLHEDASLPKNSSPRCRPARFPRSPGSERP